MTRDARGYVPRPASRGSHTCTCGSPMRRTFDLHGAPVWACRGCDRTKPRNRWGPPR